MTNLKNELVTIQTQMADMKANMGEMERKIQANADNNSVNSSAIAEVRTEVSYLNNSGSEMKKEKTMTESTPVIITDNEVIPEMKKDNMADSGDSNQIIIIEDNFTDKSSLYSYAYELYKSGKYTESISKFNEFLGKFPSDDLSDNAMYWIAEIKYTEKNFSDASKQFKTLINKYPEGNKVPDAHLKLSYSYLELGMKDKAVMQLQTLVKAFPATNAGKLAKRKLKSLGESVE
jgi:tol-pal system protein YbgF